MLFSSLTFIFRFLVLFMTVYLLTEEKHRNLVLLAGSLIFYAAGEPKFVLVLAGSVCVNYVFYRAIHRTGWRFLLVVILILDFGLLFLYKYWNFAAGTVNKINGQQLIPAIQLALPLGISFFTFQIVAFQIDNYREKEKYHVSFLQFATFSTMFPQILSGPILKYGDVSKEMEDRKCSAEKLEDGWKLFAFGLALKVLLADHISTLWVTICSSGMDTLSVPVAWLGAFAYTFQIYFDFWGYSLMAVGLGKMLGFQLPENFNNPYLSKTVSEFWRRWHITLGRWFKEYVYIPMGGSRNGKFKTIRNILIVWALTGLWHGASWNFVLWGLTFFVLITLEKNFYGKILEKNHIIGRIYMAAVIPVTWVIFAISDFGHLISYLRCMAGMPERGVMTDTDQLLRYVRQYGLLLLVCLLFSTAFPMKYYRTHKNNWYLLVILFLVFLVSIVEIAGGNSNPFLYFKF